VAGGSGGAQTLKARQYNRPITLMIGLALIGSLIGGALALTPARAENVVAAQTVWRLLDYIAVDYPGAVKAGRVISETEYGEMTEFANAVATRLAALPPAPAQAALIRRAEGLKSAIGHKASTGEVAKIARRLAADVLAAYPVALAPAAPPDLVHGAALYAEHCAACHGVNGTGDGPQAAGLAPPPIDFTDRDRARERSLFALYQVIGQGLDGTAMASFGQLPADDRWALAFHVGGLAFSAAEAGEGKRLWTSDPPSRAAMPDLEAIVQTTPAALAEGIGAARAFALTAYLRRHPEAVVPVANRSLAIARAKLTESLAAYRAGDRQLAGDLALGAYLDGFEAVEPALAARDGALMRRIEAAMTKLRVGIGRAAPVGEIEIQGQNVLALLDTAVVTLGGNDASSGANFAGAFTILLREGLEALLIIVAMVAFVGKAERPEILPYVHGGWIAALAAGVLTWVAATYLFSISGASREITEGVGSLLAAVVLVSVGIWMHGKSQGDAWQKYIGEMMSHALSQRSAWFLFFLAFVVVYREVFETILFFLALWSQGDRLAILAGAGAGTVALGGIGWALLGYSRRLPIARFFSLSSGLIAFLAVVLAGKGVAALQESGWIDISPVAHLPRIAILGLYPTWQGIAAQLVTLAILAAAFQRNRKPAPPASR